MEGGGTVEWATQSETKGESTFHCSTETPGWKVAANISVQLGRVVCRWPPYGASHQNANDMILYLLPGKKNPK